MKRRNKLFLLLLSFALAFTMLAMPVYADTETDVIQDEIVTEITPEESVNEVTLDEQENVISQNQPVEEETVTQTTDKTVVPAEYVEVAEAEETELESTEPKAADAEADATNEEAEEPSALDKVLADIETLPYDATEITADMLEEIEAINTAYEALSAEDKEAVDSKFGHPNGDTQSYGRVLEASLWAAYSYNTDQSSALPDGTYTTSTEPAVSSESNKGKSDSSRVRNWWVESVVVENGQATAYIYVTSGAATAKKLTSYPSVWIGGKSISRNSDNNYPIPVDLNGKTYFGGVSSSMPRPIMYELSTTINEPIALTVENKGKMFKPTEASIEHGPEGDYLKVKYTSSSYDKAYNGKAIDALLEADSSKVIEKSNDGYYTFPVDKINEEYVVAFRSKKNNGWYNRIFLIDLNEKKLITNQTEDEMIPCEAGMDQVSAEIAVSNATYTGKAIKPGISVKYGENVLSENKHYTVEYTNNVNAGKATVVLKGLGNFKGETNSTFNINAKNINPAIALNKTVLAYTGKTQQPAVSAVYDGKTKLPASQYTAKVTAGKNIGTYNVSVTLKGNYIGSKTVSYQIVPKGATIKAPKKAKKALTVKWKAQKSKMPKTRIAGYQIQLATDKAFTKNVKSVNVKGYKKTSKKIKKLKAKTTYYVRVRTYIKVSGKTYYSTWSAVKSAKTK